MLPYNQSSSSNRFVLRLVALGLEVCNIGTVDRIMRELPACCKDCHRRSLCLTWLAKAGSNFELWLEDFEDYLAIGKVTNPKEKKC